MKKGTILRYSKPVYFPKHKNVYLNNDLLTEHYSLLQVSSGKCPEERLPIHPGINKMYCYNYYLGDACSIYMFFALIENI